MSYTATIIRNLILFFSVVFSSCFQGKYELTLKPELPLSHFKSFNIYGVTVCKTHLSIIKIIIVINNRQNLITFMCPWDVAFSLSRYLWYLPSGKCIFFFPFRIAVFGNGLWQLSLTHISIMMVGFMSPLMPFLDTNRFFYFFERGWRGGGCFHEDSISIDFKLIFTGIVPPYCYRAKY